MSNVVPLKQGGKTAREQLAGIKVIDVDTHVTERWDLWTARAPASLRNRVPQVKVIDGVRQWVIDGDKYLGSDCAACAVREDGSKERSFDFVNITMLDAHKGAYDTRERVKMMDSQGIHAQIAYPNVMGFGGQNAMAVDEALRCATIEIYNDAMAEMQEESGERIFPMATLPWWDVRKAVAETERCAKMGLRGVNINSDPHTHGLPALGDPHWNPLWESCVRNKLPVNFHIGASDESMSWFSSATWPGRNNNEKFAMGGLMLFVGNLRVMGNILLSRFLEENPELKIVSVESGAGWIPYLLEALEYMSHESGVSYRISPTEIFQRQIYACTFFERKNFVETIRQVGADNIMFETDFPHGACLYPDGLDYMEEPLQEMTQDERFKIFSGNASRLYNIDIG